MIVLGVTSDQTLLVLRGRACALRDAGFSVTILSSPGPHFDRLASEPGLVLVPIPIRRGIAPVADIQALVRIFSLLVQLRPEIVDFSTPKAALLGLFAARLLKIPSRVHTLRGLRLESASSLLRPLLLLAERFTASCAHTVLCNSQSLMEETSALAIAPREKLRLLAHGSSNGVDPDRFYPVRDQKEQARIRAGFALPPEALVLGYTGRFTRHKGIPELIEALDSICAEEPNTWLLLVGWFDQSEDSLTNGIRKRIEQHPRIRSTGFMEDTTDAYRAMDIFIFPTHREGFPNVALEAAASALPIITTTATGARDSVRNDVTGMLVNPGDTSAITASALHLLRNSALRRQMGAAARHHAIEFFHQQKVLAATVAFFQEIAEQKTGESMQSLP